MTEIMDNTAFKMPRIVAICGDKGAGKDTLAKALEASCHYTIVRLSTPLKAAAAIWFGLDLRRSDDNDYKDTPLPTDHQWPFNSPAGFFTMALYAAGYVYNVSADDLLQDIQLLPSGKPGPVIVSLAQGFAAQHIYPVIFDEQHQPTRRPTPRLLQQLVGTEIFRNIDPDIWLWRWKLAAQNYPLVAVPDMRFPDEHEMLTALGAATVRVRRDLGPRTDKHVSEGGLDNTPMDIELDNNGTIDQLRVAALRQLIAVDELPVPVAQLQTVQ